jgi:hypothetical protein
MTAATYRRRAWWHLRRQFLSYYFVEPPIWRILLRHMADKNRVLPNFASLGAVRSGTTQLADYIMQHPCITLPLAKEIGTNLAVERFVRAQFPTKREMLETERKYGKAITGYCSPILPLLNFPYFAKTMAPNLKTIILLRDPVDRTFAQWRWEQLLLAPIKNDPLWKSQPNFDELMELEIELFSAGGVAYYCMSSIPGYLRTSIYLPFLKLMRRMYPAENIHYVNAGDFFREPVATVQRIYDFLELPPFEPKILPVRNSAAGEKMSDKTRERLAKFFAPLNQELYAFVGRDFGWQ